MLSSQVIWAIHVLSQLDNYEQISSDRNVDKRYNKGLILTTDNKMQKPVLRNVLRKLATAGYIESQSVYNAYRLKIDISDISIFQLIQLFHGGICIGEIYDHAQTIGKELFQTGEYRTLQGLESELQQTMENRLQMIRIVNLWRKGGNIKPKII